MKWGLYAAAAACIFCLTTPLWYLPYRRLLEHFGHPKNQSGQLKRATMIDWLSATGLGLFLGALLTPFLQLLWFGR